MIVTVLAVLLSNLLPVMPSDDSMVFLYSVSYGSMTSDDWGYMATNYQIVDGGGPDLANRLHRINPNCMQITYICALSTTHYHKRWKQIQPLEGTFLHAGDPAWLTLSANRNYVKLVWRGDGRSDLTPVGYLIERACEAEEFTTLAYIPIVTEFYIDNDPEPWDSCRYRIRTIIQNGDTLDYSWIQSVVAGEAETLIEVDSIALRDWNHLWVKASAGVTGNVFVDTDRDQSFTDERALAMKLENDWLNYTLPFTKVERDSAGAGFYVELHKAGATRRLPDEGLFSIAANNRLLNSEYANYVMNVASDDWQQIYASLAKEYVDAGSDGIFMDNSGGIWPRWMSTVRPYDMDSASFHEDLKQLFQTTRDSIPRHLMIFNGLGEYAVDYLDIADGGMIEGYCFHNWGTGVATEAQWKRAQQVLIDAEKKPKKGIFPLPQSEDDNATERIFAFASFLLVKGDCGFYYDADSYSYNRLYPEWFLNLGRPLETYANIDQYRQEYGYYKREYENAIVLVNPQDTNGVSLAYPIPMYRVKITGASILSGGRITTEAVRSILLFPKTAVILFKNYPIDTPVLDYAKITPPILTPGSEYNISVKLKGLNGGTKGYANLAKIGGSTWQELYDWTPGIFTHSGTVPIGWIANVTGIPIQMFDYQGLPIWDTIPCRLENPLGDFLLNSSMEFDIDQDTLPDNWRYYVNPFEWKLGQSRSGDYCITVHSDELNYSVGAVQSVTFNPPYEQPLIVEGWSKCIDCVGEQSSNYSIYVDLWYTDGTPLYGQIAQFNPRSREYHYARKVIFPEKPIAKASVYLLFRNTFTGTARFDDVTLRPYNTQSVDNLDALTYIVRTPVKDYLYLNRPAELDLKLQLFDLNGGLSKTFVIPKGSDGLPVENFRIVKGIYFIRIDGHNVSKVVWLD